MSRRAVVPGGRCSASARPLLLLDLDNTLVDRDRAFALAVGEFLLQHGLPGAEVDWVLREDQSGYRPRAELAAALAERFGAAAPDSAVADLLDRGGADHIEPDAAVHGALAAARDAGWSPVVVTNGTVAQQTAKIRNAGLDRLVAATVVSEGVGVKKPDPRIFHAAARAAGTRLADDTWMVGDSPHADIAGAHRLGLRTAWVSRGLPWPPEHSFHPVHTAADAVSAIRHAVAVGAV